MQGMWDRVLLLELSGVGAVPFLCISSLLAAPKGVKGVKEEKDLSEGLLDRKAGLVGKTALAMTRIRTIPTKRGTSEA